MSSPYIESNLSPEASNIHRALASMQEELEAVDYYHQRADRSDDPELSAVLIHNRNEEIEHAAMLLEWLRRRVPDFDEKLRTYLFTTETITEIEEDAEGGDGGGQPPSAASGSLGIGSLK